MTISIDLYYQHQLRVKIPISNAKKLQEIRLVNNMHKQKERLRKITPVHNGLWHTHCKLSSLRLCVYNCLEAETNFWQVVVATVWRCHYTTWKHSNTMKSLSHSHILSSSLLHHYHHCLSRQKAAQQNRQHVQTPYLGQIWHATAG